MIANDITHCLTIGKRPELLRQTLLSLDEALRAMPTLAVNDFQDAETSAVLTSLCSKARIVGPEHHLGHHRAIDAMYAEVDTSLIFHDEDDWHFDRQDFLAPACALLAANPDIVSVCFRDTADIPLDDGARALCRRDEDAGISYWRLDPAHPQWYGFTFNPHLIRRSLWQELGGYARFDKERHISRHLRQRGGFVAYLDPGACHHIGEDQSVAPWQTSRWRRFKAFLRGRG